MRFSKINLVPFDQKDRASFDKVMSSIRHSYGFTLEQFDSNVLNGALHSVYIRYESGALLPSYNKAMAILKACSDKIDPLYELSNSDLKNDDPNHYILLKDCFYSLEPFGETLRKLRSEYFFGKAGRRELRLLLGLTADEYKYLEIGRKCPKYSVGIKMIDQILDYIKAKKSRLNTELGN